MLFVPQRFTPIILALVAGLASVQGDEPRVVAYVPNWIDVATFEKTIDYSKVTHLNVAFENPINDQGDLSFHLRNQALLDGAKTHGVPVLVSIGGGSASTKTAMRARYNRLLADSNRAHFVAKLVRYAKVHGFAGIDVDLEGPAINVKYGAFINNLSTKLKAQGLLLTAAVSQGYGGGKIPSGALARFDFVNIMAYDATGPWDPQSPGQHSSLDFAKSNVAYWLGRGLAASKAVLGVPFYGYGFGDAFNQDGYSYADIVNTYSGAENADQAGSTIWYNGVPTIKTKVDYVKTQSLGGIMIWSLENDVSVQDNRSLLKAIDDELQAP